MTDDAIIEAAARALLTATEWSSFWGEDDAKQLATAVVAAVTPLIRAQVLEEAAAVAEDYDGEFEEIHMAQGDIAAGIRALKPASPSPSPASA